jgi:hypothetical protein
VDVVDREEEEEEEAGDRERSGGIGVGEEEGGVSGFGVSRLVLSSA